jgi:hypothetical protein
MIKKVDCSMEQYALVVWRRPNEHGSLIQTFTIEVNTGFDKKWALFFICYEYGH